MPLRIVFISAVRGEGGALCTTDVVRRIQVAPSMNWRNSPILAVLANRCPVDWKTLTFAGFSVHACNKIAALYMLSKVPARVRVN